MQEAIGIRTSVHMPYETERGGVRKWIMMMY